MTGLMSFPIDPIRRPGPSGAPGRPHAEMVRRSRSPAVARRPRTCRCPSAPPAPCRPARPAPAATRPSTPRCSAKGAACAPVRASTTRPRTLQQDRMVRRQGPPRAPRAAGPRPRSSRPSGGRSPPPAPPPVAPAPLSGRPDRRRARRRRRDARMPRHLGRLDPQQLGENRHLAGRYFPLILERQGEVGGRSPPRRPASRAKAPAPRGGRRTIRRRRRGPCREGASMARVLLNPDRNSFDHRPGPCCKPSLASST